MSHLILPFLVVAALMVVIAVMGAVMKRQHKTGRDEADGAADPDDAPATDYVGYERKRYLFSPAEYSFYKVLHLAVGADYSIQAKVRIADVIEVRKGSARWQSKFNYIAQKHVDFVLCEPKTMVPLLAIELDDSSHTSAKSQKRDGFVNGLMTAAGMPLVRVPAAHGYSGPEIKAMIGRALGVSPA